MSDFIFSRQQQREGALTQELQLIYPNERREVTEFHGEWGSLGVSKNLYFGFDPLETEQFLCIVIGGPLLNFSSNDFLREGPGKEGTRSIFERWMSGSMKWDDDLNGPFAVVIVNKESRNVEFVTDIMSFIPLYRYQHSENIIVSTHVDCLANISNQTGEIDPVSKVDFILHGIITFPYTAYKNIKQIYPATVHLLSEDMTLQNEPYWVPEEKIAYKRIQDAAEDLRSAWKEYMEESAHRMKNNAQFISGGEDSRTLAGLLPQGQHQDAFIFLDQMNREGRKAKQAASAYGANFKLATRAPLHYLDILPNCSDMVGEGSQYFHAHTFGFHENCHLQNYSGVFGGLFSDALLKGARIKKIRGSKRFPFIPQIKNTRYSPANPIRNSAFESEVLEEVRKRREDHLEYVRFFRGESAEEWFELWPSSMNMNIPNLHVNRRLFRSYEPFMGNKTVKISAAVPQKWKMNRLLFHKAAQPFLKPTKWLLHSEGKLPYFPWYVNSVIQFGFWIYVELGQKLGYIKGNQGPWAAWNDVMNSPEWQRAMERYSAGLEPLMPVLKEKDVKKLFASSSLTYIQKINLMQTIYQNDKS